jgi:hypothetical protein
MRRKNLTKYVSHKNDDVTFICPDCQRKVRVPYWNVCKQNVGGDAYCLVCPDCIAEASQAATDEAEGSE